ncbi:MAG: fumarylacetoacetate hydrolase family protein [Acidimicrobiia bacterium]|jgi:2-keto-4-pentenoate hydratase/2-oxohepta-3-ene-1,7-dioic acid hydratase in catechol pathway
MKWARFEYGGTRGTAFISDDELIEVESFDPVALLAGHGMARETGRTFAVEEVRLLSPVHPMRNVMCVGWNYLPHFEEGAKIHGDRPLPDHPAFFSKTTTTVIGPNDDVPSHSDLTDQLDYEVELGVVIGEKVTGLTEENALDAVAGYVVAQDISARDLQKAHGGQWYKGKSLDGTCPIGPWLISADEIGDPQDLDIECKIDGQVRQSSNTRHMIFPIRRLLAELSAGLTLLPGDIFLTGTPEGVGMSMEPPGFLKPGQVIESTVAGIGTLRNRVV